MKSIPWRTYLIALVITSGIFILAFLLSDVVNQKRFEEIRSIESKIAIDILSIETQFALLEDLSCGDISETFLTKELSSIGSRLQFLERERTPEDEEFLNLKKYYSLLLIKDYLLMKQVADKCGETILSILYFYSNQGDCPDCTRQATVLTRIVQLYPEVRIYALDYYLDTPAIQALTSIHHIDNEFPALRIKDETYYGFKSIEQLEELVPELAEIKMLREEAEAEETELLEEE
jgi:thiol-disulfide isomerase/thioredoxin